MIRRTGRKKTAAYDGIARRSRPTGTEAAPYREVAVDDESGAIVFLTSAPEQSTSGHRDGDSLWRAQQDGTLSLLLSSAVDDANSPNGDLTLYQVEAMSRLSDEKPGFRVTPVLVVDPDASPDEVWIAPLGDAAHWPRPYSAEEGEITGVGWQDGPYPGGQLFVAIRSAGNSWLERWTMWIGVEPWNVNPVIPGTGCPDEPNSTDCLGTVTALPGTSLIAYTETNSQNTFSYLVVFDAEAGIEVLRMQVAVAPISVKQLHASQSQVVVSLVKDDGNEVIDMPAMVVDVESGAFVMLPTPGTATVAR